MFKQDKRQEIFDAVAAKNNIVFNLNGDLIPGLSSRNTSNIDGFTVSTLYKGISPHSIVTIINELQWKLAGVIDPEKHFISILVNSGMIHVGLAVKTEEIPQQVA